jgi:hypothetical protein
MRVNKYKIEQGADFSRVYRRDANFTVNNMFGVTPR